MSDELTVRQDKLLTVDYIPTLEDLTQCLKGIQHPDKFKDNVVKCLVQARPKKDWTMNEHVLVHAVGKAETVAYIWLKKFTQIDGEGTQSTIWIYEGKVKA